MKTFLHVLMLISSISLLACSEKAAMDRAIDRYGEDVVYQHGDSILYLCRHCWTNITLDSQDPEQLMTALPWRVPTKAEAHLLHRYLIEQDTKQRMLCVATDGQYWTYLFGIGNITRAGQKTKYALRPVRLVCNNPDTIINL